MKKYFFITIYIIGFSLTYGHVYNLKYAEAKEDWSRLGPTNWNSWAVINAAPSAVIWPVYWLTEIGTRIMSDGNEKTK